MSDAYRKEIWMYWKSLDKIDSGLYKGMAILMIATHNFMHLFPRPKESEFYFDSDRFFDLLNFLLIEPENIIRALLSFFGHFGVQIFIFLSAYGLTKKYSTQKLIYWPFIWQRILRVYPAFILAILAWLIVDGWILGGREYGLLGPLKVLYWNLEDLILKLLLLSNFLGDNALSLVGPWWFIPFIFQFYFLFPFLLGLYSRWGISILIILSISTIMLSIITQGKIGSFNIYYSILGHFPEFCLGIYLARNDNAAIKVPLLVIISAFLIYFLGNVYEIFWYVNHISFLILLLALFSYLTTKIKKDNVMIKIFLFLGALSMPIFLVNGFLREPFIWWAREYNSWLLTIILCLISLLASVVAAFFLSKIESWLMSKKIVKT